MHITAQLQTEKALKLAVHRLKARGILHNKPLDSLAQGVVLTLAGIVQNHKLQRVLAGKKRATSFSQEKILLRVVPKKV